MLDRLGSLARALADDPRLEVRWGPEGSGWRFHAGARRIEIDRLDQQLDPDELRGLICHEAAHAVLTRYPFLVPKRELSDLRVAVVLNALEDCRIETWLMKRNPGTRPWLKRVNDRLFPKRAQLHEQPAVLQWALGAIHHWWHGELPEGLNPEVVRALRQTTTIRAEVVRCQPAPALYVGTRVCQLFRRLEGERQVPRREQQVRMAASRAWDLTHALLPVVLELGELHQERDVRLFLRRTEVVFDRAPRLGQTAIHVDTEATQRALHPVQVGWEALRSEMLPGIRSLTRQLEDLLLPDRAPRWSPSTAGQRVDLRRALQRAARPATLDIWQTKSVPRKRDAAFMVLVDLSGSMRGERIASALRGVVLISEVLERMGVRYAIDGFQDVAFPLKRFNQPLAAARTTLLEIPLEVAGIRPGGNNRPADNHDGPALRAAAERLLAEGSRQPVLIVISDGEPSGPEHAAEALEHAVNELSDDVHLIGLGLGPGTEHVAHFYPRHAASVPIPELPDRLATTIAEELR